jgi:voltage-gated potassium channel
MSRIEAGPAPAGLPAPTAGLRHLFAVLLAAPGLRTWLLIVLGVLVVGTAGYVLLMSWSIGDALYMTVITVTTTGFREVRELDATGRAWTMVLSVAGVILVFGTVGLVTEYVVTEVRSGRQAARLMSRSVDALSGHYVLCGYGRVGSTVARELVHDGLQLVIIDVNPASLERARDDGYLVVQGDATVDSTLRAAGITRARGLVAAIDSDAQNVYLILSARALNPGLFVVARAGAPSAEETLARAGADRIVSPYTMAGRRLAQLAVRPRVVDFLDAALSHGELSFSLAELHVPPGSELVGASVAGLRDRGLFVLAILAEGRWLANPPDDRRLAADETLVLSGSAEALAAARDEGGPAGDGPG